MPVILPFRAMVCARILRPPAHGAKLKSLDTSGISQVPGAQVVREGDLIAVLHEQPDMAEKALALIRAEFEPPENGLDDKTIYAHIAGYEPQLKLVKETGSVAEGEKLVQASLQSPVRGVIEGSYTNAYVAHATMETHTALAAWEDGKVTVRAATQVPFMARDGADTQVSAMWPHLGEARPVDGPAVPLRLDMEMMCRSGAVPKQPISNTTLRKSGGKLHWRNGKRQPKGTIFPKGRETRQETRQ